MRGSAKLWLLAVAAIAALGCSDDNGDPSGPGDPAGPGELTQADIVGTWNITKLEYHEHSPGTRVFDEIAAGNVTATVTIDADGDYTVTFTNGQDQETDSGTFEVTDEGVVDTSEGEGGPEVNTWEFTLDGNTLTGEQADGGFDFEDDGTEESVTVQITLVKAS